MKLREMRFTVSCIEAIVLAFGYTKPSRVKVTATNDDDEFSFVTDIERAPRVGDVLKVTIEQVDAE